MPLDWLYSSPAPDSFMPHDGLHSSPAPDSFTPLNGLFFSCSRFIYAALWTVFFSCSRFIYACMVNMAILFILHSFMTCIGQHCSLCFILSSKHSDAFMDPALMNCSHICFWKQWLLSQPYLPLLETCQCVLIMTTLSELVLWYSEPHKACFVTEEEDNTFGTKMLVSQLTPTMATVWRKINFNTHDNDHQES